MARRGFLAELQHQSRVAAKENARDERDAERASKKAMREAEQARKAVERAKVQLARATEKERKLATKEAQAAHVASMEADVETKNAELAKTYDEIDSLLSATLDVDDFVDLETLRRGADHPPFDRTDLEAPLSAPDPIPDPPEPLYTPPPAPNWFQAIFGKSRHAKAVADASAAHEDAVASWRDRLVRNNATREAAANRHVEAEAQRVADLEKERARYASECSAREAEAEERNTALDSLIANLGYGAADAVQEYVSIVLSNSVYPPHFPVEHDFSFDTESAELRLRVSVASPDSIASTKAYKYTKSSDEIVAVPLSQKACKDRYGNAVHEVALRSIHEVFEADRRGIIKTISLEVGSQAVVPATGKSEYIVFVATGAERDSFLQLNLGNVVPTSTLEHLGAAVSKNPFGLVAAVTSGVRRS